MNPALGAYSPAWAPVYVALGALLGHLHHERLALSIYSTN